MFLPFLDDFTPDAPFLEGGNSTQLGGGPRNVINLGTRYAPFKAYQVLTSTSGVGDTPLGMFSFRASNGTYYTIAGIDDALKRVSGTTWEDVTRTSGGAYATAAGDRWNFTSFGDRIIGVNGTDATQSYNAGVDTDFSALAATAPIAKHITTAGDFVVAGYTTESSVVYPYRVRWSAQGDPTAAWTSSATTQADFQDLNSANGVVTGVIGFEDRFYAFQERAITVFTYVGSPIIFRKDEITPGTGCIIPSSLTKAGSDIFFISGDGIKRLSGGIVNHIGTGRVDRAFWLTMSGSSQFHMITAFADPNYPIVYFTFGIALNQTFYVLAYNYVVNKWTWIFLETFSTGRYFNLGIIYTSTYPRGVLAGFASSDNKLGTFDGTAYDATFFISMIKLNPIARATISRVMVLSEGTIASSVTIDHSGSNEYVSGGNTTSLTSVGNNNQWTGRVNAVSHRISAAFSTWSEGSHAKGMLLMEHSKDGGR